MIKAGPRRLTQRALGRGRRTGSTAHWERQSSKFSTGLKEAQAARQIQKDEPATPEIDPEFIKMLRKPDLFFGGICDAVKSDLKAMPTIQGDERLRNLLNSEERAFYQETVFTNMAVSQPIAANFMKSALGLPLMGGAIYSHLFAGLTSYVLKKKGFDPATATKQQYLDSISIAPYYRSPIIIEELKSHLGYSTQQIHEAIAKSFFMQYHLGKEDPLVFNRMVRSFYPPGAHIFDGARDLGRENEFQGAKLFALGNEGRPQPVMVINAGDTLPFTDGSMSLLQNLIEANERGIAMPFVFMVSANNSSISSRMSHETDSLTDAEAGVRRIVRRFELWGEVLTPGFVTDANNVADGVEMMQNAVDQVLATGKPTWAISKYPFRPLGHASDGSPASDALLASQFHATVKTLVKQVCAAAEPGASGADLAKKLDDIETSFGDHVKFAMNGNCLITRPQIREISTPGITDILADPGRIVDMPASYFTGKGHRGFAGMGTDIYSQAVDSLFDEMDATGRPAKYIHQENHQKVTNDTRCGVYGELNTIQDKHLNTKFVNLLPNEAQVAHVAGGYKSALGPDALVICKGPHTPFNEHAADFLKYAAYRNVEAPENTGMIYIIDGSNLAGQETETIIVDGKEVVRDIFMARVGQHHSSPFYAQFGSDPNTLLSVPLDMNFFAAMLPELTRLQGLGRICISFLPTPQFGRLHPAIPKGTIPEGRGLTQNDTLRVTLQGQAPANGRELVVVAWGPDVKWITEVLVEKGVQATMLVLNYMQAPNSMISYLDDIAKSGTLAEVVCVDPNPEAAFLSPVINVVKDALDYPDNLNFSYCFIAPSYAPHGAGEGLIQRKDFVQLLQRRGCISGGDYQQSIVRAAPGDASTGAASTSSASTASSSGEEIVLAPLDGDNVVVTYRVKVGDVVKVDDVIAEVESDKANVDVLASAAGTVKELFLEAGKEMNVTMDTKVCVIACDDASSSASAAIDVVTAPLDGEKVVVTFNVKVGAEVKADEVIAVIESDKAAVDVLATSAGTIKEFFVKPGEEINVTMDTNICSIEGGSSGASSTQATAAVQSSPAAAPDGEQVTALSRVQVTMVDNMTVKAGDSRTFTCGEPVNFKDVAARCKKEGVTPNTYLIKSLAESLQALQLNKKLSGDKRALRTFPNVDIGVAVEVQGQLRVAVVRDAAKKSATEIGADIDRFIKAGTKLSKDDQDLDKVCFVLTSLGKHAPANAVATLPRGMSGILAIGRAVNDSSNFVFTFCHATLNGSEGAALLMDVARRAEGRS